jgi:hypothetical protein
MKIKSNIVTGACVLATLFGARLSSGAVTPYSWIRAGEAGGVFADSSGQNHPFNAAFSSRAGGDPAAVIVQTGAGGPLDATGAISTSSTRWGFYALANSGMWIQGPNNSVPPASQWSLPPTNWVVEVWVMPVGTGGSADHADSQFVSTGSGQFGGTPGGIAFRTHYNSDDDTVIGRVDSIGPNPSNNFTIGDPVVLSRDHWTHLAAVNDNGVTTFYVNGVANGAPSSDVTAPSGVPYIGSGQDTGAPFNGLLDEIRYSTFEPGKFAVSDLLLLPPGPNIIAQPKSINVWVGGAAIFNVQTPIDSRTTFQWKLNGQNIQGATTSELYIPNVALTDSGKVYSVVLSNSGIDVTSADATLTVIPVETENVAFYRQAVESEASLLSYFPVDNDSAGVLTNTKNAAGNGTIQGNTDFDGRKDRAFGVKSLRLKGPGDVLLPANPAYEFSDGSGTIEALVYLDTGSPDPSPKTIFSLAAAGSVYYQFQVTADGTTIIYQNDVMTSPVSWVAPTSLLNRFAHVALVFDNNGDANPDNNTVTAYVDGLPLGSKPNPGFGQTTGLTGNIGSSGLDANSVTTGGWIGNIDEVAIYGDALSANTIAVHNSRFIYGTAVTKPTIDSAPTGTRTVLAGGAPVFTVKASGTAPLSYQWKLNGAPIQNNPSATTSTLTIINSTVASSGDYTVTVSNPIGEVTSDPFTVNFVAVAPTDKYASFVLGDHPTAYWRLDEATGTTKLTDYAGGLDGTYHGDVQLGVEGAPSTAPDTAAHFPGAIKDGVPNAVVPFTPVLNPTGPFSIEFWAKPDVSGQANQAVVTAQNRNAGRAGYAIYQGFNGAAWEAHYGVGDGAHIVIGQTVPAAGRWDHVVFVWDGNSSGRIWVNGVDDTRSDSDSGGPFRPNLVVPLEIGSRFGGQFPYQGTVDDVAFYSYALTSDQINHHFSIAWVAAAITLQPAASTGTEAGDLTLTATASGYPNQYQWYKDGVALDPAAKNADNSNHYPQGVTSANLVISQLTTADAGQYHLVVTNPLGDKTTSDAAVTVTPDTTPPTVAYVTGESTLTRVRIVFNKPVTAETASVPGNYTFSGGVTAASVVQTSDPRVVDVVTSAPLTAAKQYTVSVSGVKDTRASQNLIGANSTSFTAYALATGAVAFDFYANIFGGNIENNLRTDPQFPDGVYTNLMLTTFSTLPITGGDLAGNPGFGSLGNNYGSHVYGWLKPAVSGSYRFFIRSDDPSQLWLSSDDKPENVSQIAFENGCCNPFMEVPTDPNATLPTQTSDPVALDATKSYYIEAFHVEGGGGDYVEVAWRLEGDTTAADKLTPIPGTFLSAYAPVPSAKLNLPTFSGGKIAITWTGSGKLQESTDLTTWTDVPNNPPSGYSFTPDPAGHAFYRLSQ